MPKRAYFEVSFRVPGNAGVKQMLRLIRDAVTAEPGTLDPGDDMFDLDKASIDVKHLHTVKE